MQIDLKRRQQRLDPAASPVSLGIEVLGYDSKALQGGEVMKFFSAAERELFAKLTKLNYPVKVVEDPLGSGAAGITELYAGNYMLCVEPVASSVQARAIVIATEAQEEFEKAVQKLFDALEPIDVARFVFYKVAAREDNFLQELTLS